MSEMANYVAVKRLLDRLAPLGEALTPAERGTVEEIEARYDVPGQGAFDDKLCLEVILRNVEIRARHRLDPTAAAARRIELGRESPKKS